MGPETTEAWQRLAALAPPLVRAPLWDRLHDADRFDRFSVRVGPLLVDYSKQNVTANVVGQLVALAEAMGLPAAAAAMFRGDHVNVTEDRAALHTALRAPRPERPPAVADAIEREQDRVLEFAEAVRAGRETGRTGRRLRDVVHIGIGGSHLGPALAIEALGDGRSPLRFHFLANVDGAAATDTLQHLDPEQTLFIVVSKSFSTQETQLNAATARAWFLERTCDPDGIGQHFAAITANVSAATAFGIPVARCFPMWDWVGGRYSLWSAVGLPVAIALGAEGFRALLAGAHQMDRHFGTAPLARNAPALLALLGIWNGNFLGAASHAVLPYDRRLRTLPDYLQQLEMESNGKSVRLDGARSEIHTAPIIWGGEETNGQHAFHQLLHQGTRAFSADFVASIRPGHGLAEHHRWLIANCLGQSQAFAKGQSRAELAEDPLAPHREMPGSRASTTILLDALDPAAFGALIALYEHKVFCQSVIWQINPFDQWGVELGKALALDIEPALDGRPRRARTDVSTASLIDEFRKQNP